MSATMNTIPASDIVSDVPSVIGAGSTGIDLIEIMLTTNPRVPVGLVLSFPSLGTVQSYFGATSLEATEAAVYFAGFNGSTLKPGALLLAQYNTVDVGAYLRGGNISGLTLAQLQAITGVLTITIDGTTTTSSSINLSAATSFSAAAGLITTALGITGPTVASVTGIQGATFTAHGSGFVDMVVSAVAGGTINIGDVLTGSSVTAGTTVLSQVSGTTGGTGTYIVSRAFPASPTSTTAHSSVLDVTVLGSGTIAVGDQVTGAGVGTGTFIAAQTSGTAGGVGFYTTTTQNQYASESLTIIEPVVTYDSVSGAFVVVSNTTGAASTIGFGSGTIAASLALTQATGAVTSQGAVTATPNAFMAAIIAQTTNWISFQTLFDPDAGSGNAQKQLFSAWVNSTGNRYLYLCTDTDITPTLVTDASTCMGQILKRTNSSGTALLWQPAGGANHLAAFLGGAIASIDYDQTNGRTDLCFRSQSGIVPSVTSQLAAANLRANGYNFYGIWANGAAQWQFLNPGSATGPFSWIDSYVNQVWLNNQCIDALMNLLTTVRSIPYNPQGYGMVRATLSGGADTPVALPPASPVAAALNNGVIRQNVPLSAEEAIAANALAGQTVDGVLSTTGWYLVIQPATAQVRAARESPTIILLYTDGQSIQKINLSSVLVQ
jgi:hypothetical protein